MFCSFQDLKKDKKKIKTQDRVVDLFLYYTYFRKIIENNILPFTFEKKQPKILNPSRLKHHLSKLLNFFVNL